MKPCFKYKRTLKRMFPFPTLYSFNYSNFVMCPPSLVQNPAIWELGLWLICLLLGVKHWNYGRWKGARTKFEWMLESSQIRVHGSGKKWIRIHSALWGSLSRLLWEQLSHFWFHIALHWVVFLYLTSKLKSILTDHLERQKKLRNQIPAPLLFIHGCIY